MGRVPAALPCGSVRRPPGAAPRGRGRLAPDPRPGRAEGRPRGGGGGGSRARGGPRASSRQRLPARRAQQAGGREPGTAPHQRERRNAGPAGVNGWRGGAGPGRTRAPLITFGLGVTGVGEPPILAPLQLIGRSSAGTGAAARSHWLGTGRPARPLAPLRPCAGVACLRSPLPPSSLSLPLSRCRLPGATGLVTRPRRLGDLGSDQ